jgi:hypothetical protein
MDDEEKARLEKFDQQLARHASYCADRISEVADMSLMRKGAHVIIRGLKRYRRTNK